MDGSNVGVRPRAIEADVRLEGITLLVDSPSAAVEYGIEFQ
jgi:hypothetical protein